MRALTIAAALLTVSVLTACADDVPAHDSPTPTITEFLHRHGALDASVEDVYRERPDADDSHLSGLVVREQLEDLGQPKAGLRVVPR